MSKKVLEHDMRDAYEGSLDLSLLPDAIQLQRLGVLGPIGAHLCSVYAAIFQAISEGQSTATVELLEGYEADESHVTNVCALLERKGFKVSMTFQQFYQEDDEASDPDGEHAEQSERTEPGIFYIEVTL